MLYYTILYYTILYYTILYYTILYYTILYYTILYYTILYYTIPTLEGPLKGHPDFPGPNSRARARRDDSRTWRQDGRGPLAGLLLTCL